MLCATKWQEIIQGINKSRNKKKREGIETKKQGETP